jgi:hypothetical protein
VPRRINSDQPLTPVRLGKALDEKTLVLSGRLMIVYKSLKSGIAFVLAFVRKDYRLRGHGIGYSVEA